MSSEQSPVSSQQSAVFMKERSEFIKKFRGASKEDLKIFLEQHAGDQKIRAVILSFDDEESLTEKSKSDERLLEVLKNFPVPVIALVKRRASGFLFEVVLASHLCLAAETAKFVFENKLIPQIGQKNVRKLDVEKNEINAKKASEMGLINRAVSKENLEEEALSTARKIAELAPLAIRACLRAVNQGLELKPADGLELEIEIFASIFATEDMREGTRAFLEKRKPVFKGK